MAGPGDNLPDIDPKYLQINPKEDSPQKLAAVAGKPAKYYLFATEFEILRNYVNDLKDQIDTVKKGYKNYTGLLWHYEAANNTILSNFNTGVNSCKVLKNELPGAITVKKVSIGRFEITSDGHFVEGLTTFKLTGHEAKVGYNYAITPDKIIFVLLLIETNTITDYGNFENGMIEINVYDPIV